MADGPDFRSLERQLREEGGFSVNSRGHSPKGGAMVSTERSEEVIPGTPSSTRLEEFYNSAVAPKLEHTRHGYFGGWRSEGQTYLDISQRFPNSEQAAHAVTHREQLAGYDVDKGEDIPRPQQGRLFKTEVDPSYPARRDIIGFMGGELHGALGLGERARRAERSRWTQPELDQQ